MKRARDLYALVVVLFLGAGYALSQVAYFGGRSAQVATQLDQPSIRMLSALLLFVAVGLAVGGRDEESAS